MAKFEPEANEEFSFRINGQEKRFRAMEHPNAPGVAHAMEGGKATVYRIRDLSTSVYDYAFKIMKTKYRDPSLETICSSLDKLKATPGLSVCERRCLTSSQAPEVIRQYRNLEYAILMPWIHGQSWFDVLCLGKKGKSVFNQDQSFQIASNLTGVLIGLEQEGIAHCDLSAGNVLLDHATLRIELIDVEDLCAPGFQQPSFIPLGTPGYQHRTSNQGQWDSQADRFAGAILLGEMLGWYHDEVRVASQGESYFAPEELQTKGCLRFQTLAKAVSRQHPQLAVLLQRAWESETLNECPSFWEWDQVLREIEIGDVWKTIDYRRHIGTGSPPFWATFPKPIVSSFKPTSVQWSASSQSGEREGNPSTQWEASSLQHPPQPDTVNPVEWSDSAQHPPDDKEKRVLPVQWEASSLQHPPQPDTVNPVNWTDSIESPSEDKDNGNKTH